MHYRSLIVVEAAEKMIGSYYAQVDTYKTYTCEQLAAYPNRLYCSGQLSAINRSVHFQLFQTGLDYPVFEADVLMPSLP